MKVKQLNMIYYQIKYQTLN